MAQTTPKRRAPAKPSAARKRAATRRPAPAVDKTADLSEEVLESVEAGQRAAIAAVRKFVDTVDHKLSGTDVRPSWRQEIVDSAMEMADRLVHTQYDFIRKVIDSAGKTLGGPDARQPAAKRPAAKKPAAKKPAAKKPAAK